MTHRILVTLGLALSLAACSGDEPAGMEGPLDPTELPTIDAANAVGPEDALFEGQQRFLWDAWGTEQIEQWPPAEFMLQLMEDEPETFGNQFERFGFIPDPDDDFPIGFKRGLDDPSRMHETCALCHVGELPDGRLWIGAPNGRLDWGRFQVEVNRRWATAGGPDRYATLHEDKKLALGPGRFSAESHDHPQVVPADFPPYFRLERHQHFNYLGTGRNVRSEAFLAIYAFGAGHPNPREAVVQFPPEERTSPMVEFLGQIPAPVGPAPDADDVARGAEVFSEAGCDSCHHQAQPEENFVVTVDDAEDGLERMPGEDDAFPRGSIRTSFLHRIIQDGDSRGDGMDDGIAEIFNFIVRNRLMTSPTDGYRVPDLAGLWATAPYLHNGSVPTLEDLLKPAEERPVTFMRGDFEVDTTVEGNSNQGHELGTDLSEEDRAALVAYLLSL